MKNKFISALVVFSYIYITIPNPALSKPEQNWSEECEALWSNNKAMAATQGKIINMNTDVIALFAYAAAQLPPDMLPPPDYHDAFGKAVVAFLMVHNTQAAAYWVGLWDTKTCEGAAITLPKETYDRIIANMGQPA